MNPLIQDLLEIHEILESLNIKHLVVGGVLLSLYRDGKVNPTDGDIDLILIKNLIREQNYVQELSDIFKKAFTDKGFYFEVSTPKPFFGCIVKLEKRVKTDFMIHEEYKDNYVLGYNQFYRWYPKSMFDSTTKIVIEDIKFDAPGNIEEFLFMKYRDWRTPMATTVEKKKILSKEEYMLLKPKKIDWRVGRELVWNDIEIYKNMKKYYNTIVYTAGCFDLFHIGHLNYLRECSTLGHKLIVGLGTDDYVHSFKGEGRPLFLYEHKKEIMECFYFVWKVVPHAPEYDTKVYDDEKINVLVISEDYSDTPEHKVRLIEAKQRGIEIVVLPRTKNISTTEILKGVLK